MDFLKKVATEAVNSTSNNNNNNNNNSNNNSNNNNNSGNDVAGAVMGQLNNVLGGGQNNNSGKGNDVAGAVIGQLNNVLGGGQKGEQKEDLLDKAIDLVQDKVLKAGPQDNESAIEQAKDAQIAAAIRSGYKTATGKDFPV